MEADLIQLRLGRAKFVLRKAVGRERVKQTWENGGWGHEETNENRVVYK